MQQEGEEDDTREKGSGRHERLVERIYEKHRGEEKDKAKAREEKGKGKRGEERNAGKRRP